ncbi:type IV pilus assembly protein PilM [Candidatus Moduliflexus flocculans]|uniref:Type IV pilus assembly protein PilM n=1 Tax=Candidatus Moduliflexus flocculans TaxID=1499966 RepID=A0A0S6VZT4_9BACT|nr:type IV pilus assembly protein PilM [Candidatus Moduliflexus flocculans]
MFGNSKQVVGLDIGASSIKVVQLQQSKKGTELKTFGMLPLAPEVIVDGAIMDAEVVVDTIKQAIKEFKAKGKYAAISVAGHSVIVKKIIVADMSRKELEGAIETEAQQYIPFDIEDVNVDFQILESDESLESGEMAILLVAVKKEKVEEHIQLIREAKLDPIVVDVDAFALENAYELNYEVEPDLVVGLVDIGASTMNINILQDGVSSFVRDISIGGDQYTEAIQKEFNVSFDVAERLKRGQLIEDISQDDVLAIVNTVSDDIAVEIQRSFDFFRASTMDVAVDKLYLSGGCSLFGGIDRFFEEKLGVQVEIFNPFRNIKIPRKFDKDYIESIAPQAAVAIGLALRRLETQ